MYVFNLVTPTEEIRDLVLGLPGLFNVENAVAALAVVYLSGVREDEFRKALRTFEGVKRRFDYHLRTEKMVYIDDYAHHPEELRACISAVKELYKGKKITGIFQPHLFTRTRDFADEFARSLELLDDVFLLDIYPARERPIPGITSGMLLEKIVSERKWLVKKEDIIEMLLETNPEVVLTLGAGDIDQLVNPIASALSIKAKSN